MRGQSLNAMAQPATAVSLASPPLPAPKPVKPVVATPREVLPEEDVGDAMPGDLEETGEDESSLRTDWAVARAAMERAIGSVRNHVEEIARETRERRREQRTLEEQAQVLHQRKMTVYEDAEAGPLDELRFPPGLERDGSDSETTGIFHSSEPTTETETLVDEPDQATEELAVEHPEKITESVETHEFPEVDPVSWEEPVAAKEPAIVPEELVVSPDQPPVATEEPEEEDTNTDEDTNIDEDANVDEDEDANVDEDTNVDEVQASEEAAPVPQDAPVATEEYPGSLDQAPHVPSDRLSTLLEEASDTHSEHLSSSFEFPRPDTPHPTIDDPRVASPVPFPLTSEHEDQGYGTQDDEDRITQASQRGAGKRVHWGGVEAQVAYERPQEEEYQPAEENSPPFSRLLLPAPAPAPSAPAPAPPVPVSVPTAVAQRDVRPERPTRIPGTLRRPAMPPALQKPLRKFDHGVYTVADVRWGMALDLSSADNRSPIAFGSHGWENQQVSARFTFLSFVRGFADGLGVSQKWDFQACGGGVVMKNVSSGSFLALEDMQGLSLETSVEVVTGDFPTCWEMEVMDNGGAEDGEDETADVYARYVVALLCSRKLLNPFSLSC